MEQRTAARSLPTSFEDDNDQEQEDTSRDKNKRPLVGPPTAKTKGVHQLPARLAPTPKTTSKPGPSMTTTGDKKQRNKPQKEVFATPAPLQQSYIHTYIL